MKRVTTSTGSVYEFVDGFVLKNGYMLGSVIVLMASENPINYPWVANDGWEDRFPEVGEHMYVNTLREWWISTPIVSIEEVDDNE